MENGPNRNRVGLPFFQKWVDFSWRTVNVITRGYFFSPWQCWKSHGYHLFNAQGHGVCRCGCPVDVVICLVGELADRNGDFMVV